MLSPVIIILLIIVAYFNYKTLLKIRKYLYYGVWVFMGAILVLKKLPLVTPFIKGYMGFAFLYVVMVTGALNPKWKVTIRLQSVRAIYSILGFVLLIVHPLHYASEVLDQTRSIPWYGIIAFTIMIPLFITSYIAVRKMMKPKSWKLLQKFAYVSYALILIHLFIHASSPQNRVVVVILFGLYTILKIIKHIGLYTKKR